MIYRPGQAKERIGNYLGLAQKAGKIAAGDTAASQALKSHQATLLVLAEDTAPATQRELAFLAGDLPLLWWPDKISLGLLVGKSRRGALVLNDMGFTKAILQLCRPEAGP